MSTLPSTHIRVNGRDYSLKLRSPTRMPEALGLCHLDTGLIEIRKGQDPYSLRDTLLHETLHAILASQGRNCDPEVEEVFVRALATGLLGVLRDNQWLAPWLMTDGDEPKKPKKQA
jgi:hypothetical protein